MLQTATDRLQMLKMELVFLNFHRFFWFTKDVIKGISSISNQWRKICWPPSLRVFVFFPTQRWNPTQTTHRTFSLSYLNMKEAKSYPRQPIIIVRKINSNLLELSQVDWYRFYIYHSTLLIA